MNKFKYISAIIASIGVSSCVHTMNMSDIEEPTHEIIRSNNSDGLSHYSENKMRQMPQQNKRNYFLGEHQEMQCLGDMYSAYNIWRVDAGKNQTTRTITILPVANQTNYQDVDIPKELTMQTQKIAAQLGIGHNVVYIPSTIDRYENNFYSKYDNFLSMINSPDSLSKTKPQLLNSIFIVASLIEYDDPNRIFGNNVNASSEGTVDKKSFGLGFDYSKDRFTGRIGMTFSVVYPATGVGMFVTPQFVYHPDATVSVYLDFKETSNSNEFSVSYDGGRPTLGYKDKFQKRDSKFIATSLLIERGLLKVLGRYYRMPYWRCMSENLIVNQNKQIPKSLPAMRETYGYDEHVEKNVRRNFRYIADAATMNAPFIKRPETAPNAGQVMVALASLKNSNDPSSQSLIMSDENVSHVLTISQQDFNKNFPQECNTKIEQLKNGTFNFAKHNECLANKRLNVPGSTFQIYNLSPDDEAATRGKVIFRQISPASTQISVMEQLKQVATFNARKLSYDERKHYVNYFSRINQLNQKNKEDAFVDLWLSLPYQVDSRIYPNYLTWKNSLGNWGSFMMENENLLDNQGDNK